MITVIGIPVYYHYCGGELEEISYLIKSNSCCGDDDGDQGKVDDGCCKDENLILKSTVDFTIKKLNPNSFVKIVTDIFFIPLPCSTISVSDFTVSLFACSESPPPKLQQNLIISTSVLRI